MTHCSALGPSGRHLEVGVTESESIRASKLPRVIFLTRGGTRGRGEGVACERGLSQLLSRDERGFPQRCRHAYPSPLPRFLPCPPRTPLFPSSFLFIPLPTSLPYTLFPYFPFLPLIAFSPLPQIFLLLLLSLFFPSSPSLSFSPYLFSYSFCFSSSFTSPSLSFPSSSLHLSTLLLPFPSFPPPTPPNFLLFPYFCFPLPLFHKFTSTKLPLSYLLPSLLPSFSLLYFLLFQLFPQPQPDNAPYPFAFSFLSISFLGFRSVPVSKLYTDKLFSLSVSLSSPLFLSLPFWISLLQLYLDKSLSSLSPFLLPNLSSFSCSYSFYLSPATLPRQISTLFSPFLSLHNLLSLGPSLSVCLPLNSAATKPGHDESASEKRCCLTRNWDEFLQRYSFNIRRRLNATKTRPPGPTWTQWERGRAKEEARPM